MKYIKQFESVPPLEDWYPTKPEKLDEKLKEQIKLSKVGEHIYSLQVKDADLRGLIFCKPQEYYEGYSDEFRNQAFELEDYMEWYKKFYSKDTFDYGTAWQGFNVPSYILDACFEKVKTLTYYDQIMLSVMDTIEQFEDDKYYLVGIDHGNGVLLHEFAHAMYYLNDDYNQHMNNGVECIGDIEYDELYKILDNMGYGENVIYDEIQAWVSTCPTMTKKCSIGDTFVEVFKAYYNLNILESPENIEIQYKKDLFI